MEKFKEQLINNLNRLNEVIRDVNQDNAYENLYEFFRIIDFVQKNEQHILKLPLAGWNVLGYKSLKRMVSKAYRTMLIRNAQLATCVDSWICVQRLFNEDISKNNIYVGVPGSEKIHPMSNFGHRRDDGERLIKEHIITFMKRYMNCFGIDWISR